MLSYPTRIQSAKSRSWEMLQTNNPVCQKIVRGKKRGEWGTYRLKRGKSPFKKRWNETIVFMDACLGDETIKDEVIAIKVRSMASLRRGAAGGEFLGWSAMVLFLGYIWCDKLQRCLALKLFIKLYLFYMDGFL